MAITIGDTVRLRSTWRPITAMAANADGTITDTRALTTPDTYSATIEFLSSSTADLAIAQGSITVDETGLLYYDYLTTEAGAHRVTFVGTGTAAGEGRVEFYVESDA